MPEDLNLAAMRAHYDRGDEEARLAVSPPGLLEFERTKEIVLRFLPPPPAVVADIGGGPGRYTHWLADPDGHRVVMETARALERVPGLLGIGPHLLAITRAGPAEPAGPDGARAGA